MNGAIKYSLALILGAAGARLSSSASVSTPLGSNVSKAALVIGNADYDAAVELKNPLNDAHDMCDALKGLGFQSSCYFDLKTRAQMRAAMQDFAESLSSNTVSLIYYAGHAVQINGENYLIPTGAQLQTEGSVINESVSLAYLMNQLRSTTTYLNIVLLDACRNNPLRAAASYRPQGLAQVTDIPDSTVVVYATAANAQALDGQGRNGVFTKSLLTHLHEDGSINDLFDNVSNSVRQEAAALGSQQQPALYKNFSGQYCLVKCTRLEELQAQRQESDRRKSELEARIAQGDRDAKAQLALEQKRYQDLEVQTKAEKAAADKKARQDQARSYLPPAL